MSSALLWSRKQTATTEGQHGGACGKPLPRIAPCCGTYPEQKGQGGRIEGFVLLCDAPRVALAGQWQPPPAPALLAEHSPGLRTGVLYSAQSNKHAGMAKCPGRPVCMGSAKKPVWVFHSVGCYSKARMTSLANPIVLSGPYLACPWVTAPAPDHCTVLPCLRMRFLHLHPSPTPQGDFG